MTMRPKTARGSDRGAGRASAEGLMVAQAPA
jgi:hypothetical protein